MDSLQKAHEKQMRDFGWSMFRDAKKKKQREQIVTGVKPVQTLQEMRTEARRKALNREPDALDLKHIADLKQQGWEIETVACALEMQPGNVANVWATV